MKNILFFVLCMTVIMSSCGIFRKSSRKSVPPPAAIVVTDSVTETATLAESEEEAEVIAIPVPEPVIPREVVVEDKTLEAPIREVTEKLVPVPESPTRTSFQYFVIIGSFRNHTNAVNYQNIIKKDGFSSVLVKNEQGLHRVSVLGTNNLTEARNEVRRIRNAFPKYHDTWLLIQAR